MAEFLYNSGLAKYTGSILGQLVVDTTTLITLAKSESNGAALNLLFNTGRQVVITSTVLGEATANMNYQDAQTISNWVNANLQTGAPSPRLIVDNNSLNPAPGSSNIGEKSIIDYVNRSNSNVDIRVISDDLQ